VAGQLGCSLDMVDLAAICSTQHEIFMRPFEHQHAADLARQQFSNAFSDHITHLNAFNAFCKTRDEGKVNLDEWCENCFVNRRGLEDAWNIREDLHNYMRQTRVVRPIARNVGDDTIICRALARAMFTQVAIQRDQDEYRTVHGNQPGLISPASALVGANHEWIVYQSFLTTSKPYFQMVTAINAEWLVVGPRQRYALY
jgi:pre-mRNA-splicing factor ATP-dependent RNA helicase DHX15/PRP43